MSYSSKRTRRAVRQWLWSTALALAMAAAVLLPQWGA